jgi:hypothetical protein
MNENKPQRRYAMACCYIVYNVNGNHYNYGWEYRGTVDHTGAQPFFNEAHNHVINLTGETQLSSGQKVMNGQNLPNAFTMNGYWEWKSGKGFTKR